MKILNFLLFLASRFLALLLTLVVSLAALFLIQNRGLPSTAPSPYFLSPKLSGSYLDMHVHTAGLGYGGSGCFISNAMRTSFKFPIYLRAICVTEEKLKKHGDAIIVEQLSAVIRNSRYVSEAVLLALDGHSF